VGIDAGSELGYLKSLFCPFFLSSLKIDKAKIVIRSGGEVDRDPGSYI